MIYRVSVLNGSRILNRWEFGSLHAATRFAEWIVNIGQFIIPCPSVHVVTVDAV